MSQEQNKAQVILVSFFGAMATVMEKVQLGFVCPQNGTENNGAYYRETNFETQFRFLPSISDFMLSKTSPCILEE